ncbi:MAG: Calx-beta domain-containing protein [Ilumatobacteraceae bacterium]
MGRARSTKVVGTGIALAFAVATLVGVPAGPARASTPGVGPFDGDMEITDAHVTGAGEIRFHPVASYRTVETTVFWDMTAWVSGPTGFAEYTYQPGCVDNGDCTAVRIFEDTDGTWVIGDGHGGGPFGCTHDWTFHLEGTYVATLESVKDPGFFYNHAGLAQADFAGPMPSQSCSQRPDPSVSSTSVTEGNSGSVTATVTVTLSEAPASSFDVSWQTVDGTAAAGSDFTAASGTLTFAAGQTSRTVGVTVTGDRNLEPNETFGVRATNGIWSSTGTVTITNDEPTVTVSSPSVTEGNAGTSVTTLHVTLSAALPVSATLSWAAAEGTASTPSDFVAAAGSLTFTAGQTDRTFTVTTNGDLIDEADQTVALTIRNADASVVATGTLTILDDDAAPTLSISSPTVIEGNTGSPNSAVFSVSIDGPTELGTSFGYSVQDITTDTDDHAGAAGTVTLHDATPGSISVRITSDIYFEADEIFRLTLTNLVNASGVTPGGAVATITNDDAKPLLKVTGVSVTERNAGWQYALVKVSIPYPAHATVHYDWTTHDGTARAVMGDYREDTQQDYQIAEGYSQDWIWVRVYGDHTYEKNEAFKVAVSGVVNARVTPTSGVVLATGTIKNDDTAPTISFDTPSILEGASGQTPKLTFTGHLDAASEVNASIRYYIADGTATRGADYTAVAYSPTTTRSATIKAGTTSVVITVPIIGAATVEPNETLSLVLTTGVGITIVDPTGRTFTRTITIYD